MASLWKGRTARWGRLGTELGEIQAQLDRIETTQEGMDARFIIQGDLLARICTSLDALSQKPTE